MLQCNRIEAFVGYIVPHAYTYIFLLSAFFVRQSHWHAYVSGNRALPHKIIHPLINVHLSTWIFVVDSTRRKSNNRIYWCWVYMVFFVFVCHLSEHGWLRAYMALMSTLRLAILTRTRECCEWCVQPDEKLTVCPHIRDVLNVRSDAILLSVVLPFTSIEVSELSFESNWLAGSIRLICTSVRSIRFGSSPNKLLPEIGNRIILAKSPCNMVHQKYIEMHVYRHTCYGLATYWIIFRGKSFTNTPDAEYVMQLQRIMRMIVQLFLSFPRSIVGTRKLSIRFGRYRVRCIVYRCATHALFQIGWIMV